MRRDPDPDRRPLLFNPAPEREVERELAFHLEQRIREYEERGMDPAGARAAALERFGDVGGVRAECTQLLAEDRRAERRRDWLADLRQDLEFGVRSALRAPLFSLLAVVTLALGIGANAAVFGVVKSVLLDALPYADAGRLVRLYSRRIDGTAERLPISPANVRDLSARGRAFTGVAAFDGMPRDGVYEGGSEPRVVKIVWAEPALFRTLGVRAALGRLPADDDAKSDTARAIVLTHGAWLQLLGGDVGAIGKTIRINGIPRTLVGVLPRGFVGPVSDAEAYFPLRLDPYFQDPIGARRRQWLGAVARLRPGASLEAARRETVAIAADIAREFPAEAAPYSMSAMPVRDAMVGDTRTPLLVLMASAGLVLLITCANLAGALLSRTISRRKEFAVRAALGAGRGRLVRQLLTESMVLAAAGGALGLLLAQLGLSALRGLAASALPSYAGLSLDGGAVAVTSLVVLATGLAFGLAPALAAGRANQEVTLREEGRAGSESRRSRRLRGMLVAGQIALCVSILAGAGLLTRSLLAMTAAPLGFDPDGALTIAVQLPRGRYPTGDARMRFIAQYEERLRALPGVVAVGSSGSMPTRIVNHNSFFIEGAPPLPDDARPSVLWDEASDGYFRALGVPVREGRAFTNERRGDSITTAIVSERLARRWWPNGGAVGARIRLAPEAPLVTIVGVVGDVRNDPAQPAAEPELYVPMTQNPWNGPVFVIRTRGEPGALVKPVQRELEALDPTLPRQDVATLRAAVDEHFTGRKLPALLMSAFGALALLLASVGVYAMFASMAAAREREFGVRMALGSSRRAIAALVLRQGGVWMGVGLAAGAIGVVAVARLVRGLLYGVAPFDVPTLAGAVLMLLACGTIALLVPVRRATRVDPITSLRAS